LDYYVKMKPGKLCLFCNGKGMSKEHFWPDWVGPYLKKHEENTFTNDLLIAHGKNPVELKQRRVQPGNLFTKKLRVVCVKCNTGWMSRFEGEVKPILLTFLENRSIVLDTAAQEKLAQWVVMKVLVSEHSGGDKIVTPKSDLNAFYLQRKFPENFRVFIGRHSDPSDSAYVRHSMTFATSKNGPNPPLDGRYGNTQSITFLLGSLCVHVISSRIQGFDLGSLFVFKTLRRILPIERESISWPIEPITPSEGLRLIANSLDQIIHSPMVKAVTIEENPKPTP
jgi:hypothetical protein